MPRQILYFLKYPKNRKNSKKISEWRKNQDDTKNVTGYEPVRNPPKVKESKVKESKVKESKVNNNTPVLFPELSGECAFNEYWDLYNKKVGDKKKCQKKWESLPIPERYKILEFIPLFKTQFTDIQYQPYPETFLSQKRWLDEIVIQKQVTIIEGQKTPQPTKRDFSRESDFN